MTTPDMSSDDLTAWRALAGECIGWRLKLLTPPVTETATLLDNSAAALLAACDRIEALEGETALLKGPHEERTPLEERDQLRARLAEVEGEHRSARSIVASVWDFLRERGAVAQRDGSDHDRILSSLGLWEDRVRAEAVREALGWAASNPAGFPVQFCGAPVSWNAADETVAMYQRRGLAALLPHDPEAWDV